MEEWSEVKTTLPTAILPFVAAACRIFQKLLALLTMKEHRSELPAVLLSVVDTRNYQRCQERGREPRQSCNAALSRDAIELTVSDRSILPVDCLLILGGRGSAATPPLKSDFLPRFLSVFCSLRVYFNLIPNKYHFSIKLHVYQCGYFHRLQDCCLSFEIYRLSCTHLISFVFNLQFCEQWTFIICWRQIQPTCAQTCFTVARCTAGIISMKHEASSVF